MSIFLYRLGDIIGRHRGVVVAVWMLLLVALGGASATLGTRFDDSFSIPGTDSQQGQDLLAQRFGQTGSTGQVLFSAREGKVTDSANADAVAATVKQIDELPGVSLDNPLKATTPMLNTGSTATLGQVRFASKVPSEHTLDAVQDVAHGSGSAGSSGVKTSVGGDVYKTSAEPSKTPELLGLLVSFLILVVTFASLLSAGMPIVTALLGVGVTITSVTVVSHLITVSSTAPTLAEMLGLAVGIDYALFILSRHRAQLAEGVPVGESMCRALATAGSAVMFAGATVIIALAGLSVAKIPVLTVMGLGAAGAVAIAVCIALTLLPAIALLLGERLRPKPRRPRRRRKQQAPAARPKVGFATRYVHAVTRWPILTVVAVVVLLGLASAPATHLRLALPDNSTAPTSTPQRQTYDAITRAFGEGYNAPLAVTADIITSSDPKDTTSKLADAIKDVPGVVAVPQESPDQGGDTALVQVIPRKGQTAPSTGALVHELRARAPALEKKYGVSSMLVTGSTAVNIDASDRLGEALLPFAFIVIGLSLILLMIVFRSIAVPVKATLGYLLSVGTALGAVVAVFELGWADALVPGLSDGPVVSFLPIFVMGVLFGLAMDYEMFLVSAMREHFVASGEPREAVVEGFRASSRVVTAAALIMTSVFVAFIPAGSSTIKQIAFGLAVGVFVDAFVVRMTLVPAVLMLLNHWAWWLPGWLERTLPVVDVEGAALHRKIAFQEFQAGHGATTLLARALVVHPGDLPLEVAAGPGEVTQVTTPGDPRVLGRVLVGRRKAAGGDLVVDGLLLPEQREAVTRRAVLLELDSDLRAGATDARIRSRVRLLALSGGHRERLAATARDLVQELAAVVLPDGGDDAVASSVVDAALGLATGVDVVVLSGLEELSDPTRQAAARLGEELARRGCTVIVVGRAAPPLPPPPHRATEHVHERILTLEGAVGTDHE